MKDSIGVTDNDWFAYLTLLKQDWHKAQGSRLTAIKSNWAKVKNMSLGQSARNMADKPSNRGFSPPCESITPDPAGVGVLASQG